jgi:glycosyltransferase involved in cell wall biosynthesis
MSSVDVIVPCYRYGHFLRHCVESVLNQSIENIRVLVIDDASPDDTQDVATDLVKEDSRVTFIRHRENKGHIATYNEGIEWASADYMLILSADDCLLPGALDRAADLMNAHPDVGFTFGNVIDLNSDGSETPRPIDIETKSGQRIFSGLEFIDLTASEVLVHTCTAIVRTKLQKYIGGYRPELPHAGDMEMWLRFSAHGSVGFISAYQGVYRRHSANMSAKYFHYTENGRFVHTTNGRLADLQQRRVALNCFFESCREVLPNYEYLRRKLFRSLSSIAVKRASAAFNEGQMEVSQQLADFAVEEYPEIKKSREWTKFALKRQLGRRVWLTLWPAVGWIRGRTT